MYSGRNRKHCSTDAVAYLYINGGELEEGGFHILSIEVNETATNCGSITPTSSASTPRSSASTELTGNGKGPVSQYGQLQAGKLGSQGRIFGSCPSYSEASGNPVKVRGMSLFWSIDESATPFYNEAAIDALVSDMKIEVIRIAMGTSSDNWGGSYGYAEDPTAQKNYIKTIVNAAIKNDIYVIIDWHSHTAHTETALAKSFFSEMAKLYGDYDNVIFEIYNEPATTGATATNGGDGAKYDLITWSTIKSYATTIISAIREYSDNLIVVGTPSWSANVKAAASSPINDPNVAYTFHFYASSHTVASEGSNVATAIKSGLPVFVTEWGTCTYTGDGTINSSANTSWQSWLDTYDLSAANWAAGQKDESCAAFSTTSAGYGSLTGMSGKYFTYSGNLVKGYIANSVPASYTACAGTTIQSSSSKTVASSSSRAVVSSSSRATVSSSSKTVVSSSSNPFADDDFASSSSKKVSSSSKTTVPSSSSKVVATASEWDSDNANLSDKSETGVIVGKLLEGSKRTITRELTLNKNEDYVVSFRAVTEGEEGTVKIKVTDGDKKLCVDAFDISEKKTTVSCDFTAASKSATLTITISGTNENVTLSKFKLGDGTDAIKVAQKPNFGMSVNNKHLYITANVAASVQVFDVMGNMVLKAFKPANASDVSLENVTDGNYIIRVKSRNGVQAIKASLK